MNHAFRFSFALTCLFMAAIPTFFGLGPLAEIYFRPPAKIEATDVAYAEILDGDRVKPQLLFRTHTIKARPCKLDLFSFRWLFDHAVEATPVYVDETGELFQPKSVMVVGERTSRMLRTEIPAVAYNFKMVTFSGTAYFTCHVLWPLPVEFSIDVPIPEP